MANVQGDLAYWELDVKRGDRKVGQTTVEYSPDGKRILARSNIQSRYLEGYATLWDADTRKKIKTIGIPTDKHLIPSPSGSGEIRIADYPVPVSNIRNRRRNGLGRQRWPKTRERIIQSVKADLVGDLAYANLPGATASTVTHDGSKRIVAYAASDLQNTADEMIVVWNTKTQTRMKTVEISPEERGNWDIEFLTLSPNDRYLVIGYPYHVFLLDLKTERTVPIGELNHAGIHQPTVVFSPDSQSLFVYGYRRTLWNTERGELLADLGAYNGSQEALFSANGRFLVCRVSYNSKGPDGIVVISTTNGRLQRRFGDERVLLDFSLSGSRFVAHAGDLKTAVLFDLESGETLCELLSPEGEPPIDLWMVPDDGRFIATYRNGLAVWDFDSASIVGSYVNASLPAKFGPNDPMPLYWDGPKRFVTVHDDGAILWDLKSGQPLHWMLASTANGPLLPTTLAIFGTQPNTLLTVTPGHDAILWDLVSGEQISVVGTMPKDINPNADSVWLGRDDRQLFVRQRRGQAIIEWEMTTGTIVKRYFLVNEGQQVFVDTTVRHERISSSRGQ
ncbi:WD40 repeat domain-containing protein [Novipirellula artificiosorum]|uniref:WD40 repeat domain-containing protein n=1 Tax=Novipirellula artificiosorum TaxID=2528016 RepID=A0A5C6DMK1_9BACT|nr:hypothetical protein [Novipirellula artificiosorum]TWU36156.1 hypothetical protein Poly41_39090 [Novipirellula artificiosorum]